MRSFASDNNSGVHPLVMEALNRANQNHAVGYGDDPWTKEAVRKIKETFSPDCEPLFVFNGTGSNAGHSGRNGKQYRCKIPGISQLSCSGTELSDSWCPHSGFATDCKSDSKRPL